MRMFCLVILTLLSFLAVPSTESNAQRFRGGYTLHELNFPMCKAIRDGTWKGSYAATFGTSYGTSVPKTSFSAAAQAPTPLPVVHQMLELVEPTPTDLLYDVGCGDGRFLEAAVRDYHCPSVGIEVDSRIALSARSRLSRVLPAGSPWRVVHGDAIRYDLSNATIACLYLYPSTLTKIVPKLTGCDRIVSYQHEIPGELNQQIETEYGPIYLVDKRRVEVKWKFVGGVPVVGVSSVKWQEWNPATHMGWQLTGVLFPQAKTLPAIRRVIVKPKPVAVIKKTPVVLCRT